ncbi:Serine phosphatase RsbU, regulator of sigma subunit [Paenibacillus sp. UNCCL117]|uniref:SpoIIE family protein phosphatase n=1 Tax=unclassified Paenibacillus TaxID=185978 RepID=UPI0008908E06|nr:MULTISPECIES: SpoIIE family protein phosphatase [unclassified Paenibacillus]SDD18761.1 Serine phosphatase RsbU, regulator of sigma subunit [Paenibacillus sp. cl123]SFW35311.1 Serine phosphatase RsbU, regulator of sigma subunit [Paenibacillus sp. UNCCL117]
MKYYDKGTLRIIGFASLVIVFSMLLIGGIVYVFTESGVVKKLKEKDLPVIAQAMAAKVEARIERSKETSYTLAADPEVRQWLTEGEPAGDRQRHSLQRLTTLVEQFGYSNSFIVSSGTSQYWGEGGQLLGKISPNEPADRWFYDFIASGRDVEVNLDYNKERQEAFVFTNALVRQDGKPLAAVGVGQSLKDLAEEFRAFKYGTTSRLWLINPDGEVILSADESDYGRQIDSLLNADIVRELLGQAKPVMQTLEFKGEDGELTDLISYPLSSTSMQLLFQIERQETVSFLNRIKMNTVAVSLISFVLILFLFYYVSHRLANPYERALQMNQQLERKVRERTQELAEHNEKLMDSIDYAKRIQESLLLRPKEWDEATKEHVLLYKPRDGVGGDFHWVKPLTGGTLIAIGDCTGHGVPGALMTMLSITLLDRVAEEGYADEPARVLGELNRLVKQTLHQTEPAGLTDDGLDIGLCYINEERTVLRFAGAKCSLYVRDQERLHLLEGGRKSIGYRRTPMEYPFLSHELRLHPGTACYMATDGFFDQSGGEKGYAFGKRRFLELLERHRQYPLREQAELFWAELESYMGDEAQRDDITLLAFQAS